jgi:hypothetical protein
MLITVPIIRCLLHILVLAAVARPRHAPHPGLCGRGAAAQDVDRFFKKRGALSFLKKRNKTQAPQPQVPLRRCSRDITSNET